MIYDMIWPPVLEEGGQSRRMHEGCMASPWSSFEKMAVMREFFFSAFDHAKGRDPFQ